MTQSISLTRRRGTISLLLVLALMLSVAAAVTTTTRAVMKQRRSEVEQCSVRQLEAAIRLVDSASIDASSPIRLPLDVQRDHWIEVQTIEQHFTAPVGASGSWLKASEIRGRRVLRSINRSADPATKNEAPE